MLPTQLGDTSVPVTVASDKTPPPIGYGPPPKHPPPIGARLGIGRCPSGIAPEPDSTMPIENAATEKFLDEACGSEVAAKAEATVRLAYELSPLLGFSETGMSL